MNVSGAFKTKVPKYHSDYIDPITIPVWFNEMPEIMPYVCITEMNRSLKDEKLPGMCGFNY